jgi:hypothetical protein
VSSHIYLLARLFSLSFPFVWSFFLLVTSECQAKAWKTGHKQKCPNLADANARFVESLQAIEERHKQDMQNNDEEDNDSEEKKDNNEATATSGGKIKVKKSITPHNADIDYILLMMMLEHGKKPYVGTGIENKIVGPTMAILYRNLERVMNGEWWFYSPQEYLTLVDYDERVRRLHGPSHDNIEREEVLVVRDFLYFLAFDYVQYGKDTFGRVLGNALPDDYVFKMLCHENENSVAKRKKQTFGIAMPAKRFIRLYLGDNNMPGDLRRQNSTQRQWRGHVLKEFREKFHK